MAKMTKKEAKTFFKPYLKKVCPTCDKPAGELCDTPTVWVHAERIKDAARS